MERSRFSFSMLAAAAAAYNTKHMIAPEFMDSAAGMLLTEEEYEQQIKLLTETAFSLHPSLSRENTSPDAALQEFMVSQILPTFIPREAYCEMMLRLAVQNGASQYVIIGAGFSTFPWRSPELMGQLTVFEADFEDIQTEMLSRCKRAKLHIPENLQFVQLDRTDSTLPDSLRSLGFDPAQKTVFSLPGASYYMTESQLHRLLSEIGEIAAEGSLFLLDYADETLFRTEDAHLKTMLHLAKAGGRPMQFCCHSSYLLRLLESHGFLLYEELGAEEINSLYLEHAALSAFDHIRFVTAVMHQKEPSSTKECILRYSLRLFAKYGYPSVSVRDIAGGLGITQSALYKHFQNKQDILDRILQRMEERNLICNPAGADLEAFCTAQFRCWTQNPFASAFRRMLVVEQYRNPEMAQLYNHYFMGGMLQIFKDLLRQKGYVHPEQSAMELYGVMFLLMNRCDTTADKAGIFREFAAYVKAFTEKNEHIRVTLP